MTLQLSRDDAITYRSVQATAIAWCWAALIEQMTGKVLLHGYLYAQTTTTKKNLYGHTFLLEVSRDLASSTTSIRSAGCLFVLRARGRKLERDSNLNHLLAAPFVCMVKAAHLLDFFYLHNYNYVYFSGPFRTQCVLLINHRVSKQRESKLQHGVKKQNKKHANVLEYCGGPPLGVNII